MSANRLSASRFKQTARAAALALAALATLCAPAAAQAKGPASHTLAVRQPQVAGANKMQLRSQDFAHQGSLPDAHAAAGFGCTGGNLSPELHWSGVPANAKSLVLTVYDPDAPTGSGFWHWALYNIAPSATGLAQGAADGKLPEGAQTVANDAAVKGYVGACPPAGDKPHRYIFTLYALSSPLDLPANATPALLGFNLNGKVLATAQLIGRYGRAAR